jgi:predicted nucleic acid-binding Zn ribbon protein
VTAALVPSHCRVCGVPIRRNNKYGVCSDQAKPACEKARRLTREGRSGEEQKSCKVCAAPLRCNNRTGICSNRDNTECMRVRQRAERGVTDPMGQPPRIIIKAGDPFGLWTALEDYSPPRKTILCRCGCENGTKKPVRVSHLVDGRSLSCGCARYVTRARKERTPYLAAKSVYGLLTALEDARTCNDRPRFHCECGNEKEILAVSVKLGYTKSCNCLTKTLGGFSKHPLYQIWASMHQRCENPNHASYHNYGGQPDPIAVCDRWRDPWLFAEDIYREIGPRTEGRDSKGRVLYELDRTNNSLGYQPGNVRWATRKTQRSNQRTVRQLTLERNDARRGQAAAIRERDEARRERDALAIQVQVLMTQIDALCGGSAAA